MYHQSLEGLTLHGICDLEEGGSELSPTKAPTLDKMTVNQGAVPCCHFIEWIHMAVGGHLFNSSNSHCKNCCPRQGVKQPWAVGKDRDGAEGTAGERWKVCVDEGFPGPRTLLLS